MLTNYQITKAEELTGLGWSQNDRRNLPGPGRAPMRYILIFSNKLGMQAYVYPSRIEHIGVDATPVDRLSMAAASLL